MHNNRCKDAIDQLTVEDAEHIKFFSLVIVRFFSHLEKPTSML